jgi:hypothetical protein
VSAILLVVAALLARSATQIWRVDPGYATKGLYIVQSDGTWQAGLRPADNGRLSTEVASALAGVPGVRAVSQVTLAPFFGSGIAQAAADSPALPEAVHFNQVDTHYFEAVGAPLAAGRLFLPHEPNVVVVNAALARHFWHDDASSLGRTLFISGKGVRALRPMHVVGVAPTLDTTDAGTPDAPTYYEPLTEAEAASSFLIVRADEGVPVQQAVASAFRAIDPSAFALVTAVDAQLRARTAPARVGIAVTGSIGLLALVVAAVGIHGLIAFTVASRTRDIGVYRALGASAADVLRLIVSWTMRGVLAGAIGAVVLMLIVTAMFGSRMRGALYGLHPFDPVSFLVGVSMLAIVIGVAIYLPARRALGLAPLAALRSDS